MLTATDLATIRTLFEEHAAGLEVRLCFQDFALEVAQLPGRYAEPDGGLWLIESTRTAAGCVALRPLDSERAEMKRLYVCPSFRGRGLGAALTQHVIAMAKAKGYRRLCHNTLPSMANALALDRADGFVEIVPHYAKPVPGAYFLERLWS